MNIKNNKRSQETAGGIKTGFVSLLQDKSLREISVSDICEIAEINRSTFYAHYKDTFALAKDFRSDVEKSLSAIEHKSDDYSWIFECVKKNKYIYNAYFKIDIYEDYGDYKTAYFSEGVHSVVKLWFEEGCNESPEEMGKLIKRILNKYPKNH